MQPRSHQRVVRRSWLAALAQCAASCAQAPVGTCDVQALANNDLVGQGTVVHCESYLSGTDGGAANAMLLAQQCVLSALGKGLAFTLVYDDPVAPDRLRAAISGFRGPSRELVRYYVSSVNKAGQTQLSVKTCNEAAPAQALEKSAGCTPGPGKPCLTCNNPGLGSLLCGG